MMGRARRDIGRIGPAGQLGQALTEMAILSVVLIPLLLLIPLLGKYAHIQQNTQQAARAAAWEATVVQDYEMGGLDRDQQQVLLIDRYFGHADVPITTAPGAPTDGDVRLGGSMYNTHTDQPLLEREDIVLGEYQFEDQLDLTGTITGWIPDWLPGEFPPSRNGLVTAQLQINPRNLRYADGSPATSVNLRPFDDINLEFAASHTLLADPWSAAGSGLTSDRRRSAYQQVRTLVPSTNFSFFGNWMERIEVLEILPILGALTRLRPGYAQDVIDVVPEDRLQDYPGAP